MFSSLIKDHPLFKAATNEHKKVAELFKALERHSMTDVEFVDAMEALGEAHEAVQAEAAKAGISLVAVPTLAAAGVA